MSELEISLLVGIILFVLGFIVDKVFWAKARSNQERIDNAVITSVKDNEIKLIEIDKLSQRHEFRISNLERESDELRRAWAKNNESLGQLTNAITSFDSNMKVWHKDISTQNAEIKKSLDMSNQLMQETAKINSELIGWLKRGKDE